MCVCRMCGTHGCHNIFIEVWGQLCGFGFLSPPFHSYLGLYLGLPDHMAYALTMKPFYLETVDL